MPRRPALSPAQRVEQLEAFVAEHKRLPYGSPPDEYPLCRWMVRAARRQIRMSSDLYERFDAVLSSTPRTRKPRTGTIPGAPGVYPPEMRDYNETQREQSADWMADAARRVLPTVPQRLQPLLQARIDQPDATLAELAAQFGLTKDAYNGRLMRAMAPRRRR